MNTWHWLIVCYLCVGIGLAGGIYLQSSRHEKPSYIGSAATVVMWPAVGALLIISAIMNKAWH